jgi:peptidoglycan/xylan/chitin deacetylase (PgdA/CDA1 family)
LLTVVIAVSACSGTPAPVTTDGASDGPAPDAAVDAAVDAPVDAPPPTLATITPSLGSVEGGTTVTLDGSGFQAGAVVTIGGLSCMPVAVSATAITCVTANTQFVEGAMDVEVTNPGGASARLVAAFTYECPWTTSSGRRSCGAVPPRSGFAAQPIASWVTQFQPGHGFVANAPATVGDNVDDATDAIIGTQSAVIETAGSGAPRTLTRTGLAPIDFTNHIPKLWVKLDNVVHATALQLVLGSGTGQFRFSFSSTQGQRWTSEGDWVAFTISWSPENVTTVGTPNRAAITDVQLRVVDDAGGVPVRLHVNGVALVPEPATTYPSGVVSFTFDDNVATMVSAGAPVLAQYSFPATAYVITDMVGRPGRASLADLVALQNTRGWEIAAHSFTDDHHAARFPNLTPQVLEDDLVDSRAWLIANRFTGYDHCAYPGGDFTGGIGTDVLALARRYFATCRTIYQGERETYVPADSVKLRVFYVTSSTTLARAIAAVDNARAHREWIILVFHHLVTSPMLSTEWSAADFTALVTHVASTGMPVKTVGQVLGP